MTDDRHALAEVRVDLIRTLYGTVLPTCLMGAAATASCFVLAAQGGAEAGVQILLAAMLALVTAGRTGLILLFQRRVQLFAFESWEKLYAAGSFIFSLTLGLVGMHAFWSRAPEGQVLAIALLFAYSAGVIGLIAVRPWIAVTSLLIVALPYVVGIAWSWNATWVALYILLLLMFVAGLNTLFHNHRVTRDLLIARARLADLARNDPLTGLANRLLLEERLDVHLAQRGAGDVALHYIDLDRFKQVNDRYGHPVGDAVLRTVARRLSGLLRRTDFAARLGGDEFVVVQMDVGSKPEAQCLGERIVAVLCESYEQIGDAEMQIGASAGITISSEHSTCFELLAQADQALYAAKRAGRGTVMFYDPDPAAVAPGPLL